MTFFCSTSDSTLRVSLKDAVLLNVPSDGGLFIPAEIPIFKLKEINEFQQCDYATTAFKVLSTLLNDQIQPDVLHQICVQAFNFDVKLQEISQNLYCLELFHGPTLAFKDFGVRFLAELITHYCQGTGSTKTILTATSGDTGGAVASAFFNRPGFEVFVLYPKNKISNFQQHQITSFGNNIKAVAVDGSFDDCQRLVKQALVDKQITQRRQFISANSINIARLLPQICYYFRAFSKLGDNNSTFDVSVPSGNFGNLTSAVIAKKMGLPIGQIIAATNTNDVVPRYLATGDYVVGEFHQTLSSAMDIADPNNFVRTKYIYNNSLDRIRQDIQSFSFDDQQTASAILHLHTKYNYLADPHTSIAYLGLQKLQSSVKSKGVFVGTAHVVKFKEVVESCLGKELNLDQFPSLHSSNKNNELTINPNIESVRDLLQ
jgi:threonine synthase